MPKKRTLLSDDPWANEIEEVQQSNLVQKTKIWGKSALLITIVGSLILVIGDLAGTGITIKWGAEDASDFAIIIEPINSVLFDPQPIYVVDMIEEDSIFVATATISVEDFHPILRPYKFNVFLRALDVPENVEIRISPKEVKAGESADMTIFYYYNSSSREKFDDYPITIEGTGGDGRKRKATFFISTEFIRTKFIKTDETPPILFKRLLLGGKFAHNQSRENTSSEDLVHDIV